MSFPFRVIVCCSVLFAACDRDRAKSAAELLAEDTTLALDLARANDALGEGEPDMSIGLTDDEPPSRARAAARVSFGRRYARAASANSRTSARAS